MAWKRKTGVDTTTSLPTGLASWRKISSYIKQLIKASQYEYHESEAFEVKDVILNDSTQPGAVIGTFINNPTQEILGGIVLPLMPNITNIPLIGEHVVVTEYNGQHYYTSIINRKSSINENAIPGASGTYEKNTKYGDTFERKDVKKIYVNEGDIVFEGRFGQSIKFGSERVIRKINRFNSKTEQKPQIKIVAGHRGTTENIDKDDSSIHLLGAFGNADKEDKKILIKSNGIFITGRDNIRLNSEKVELGRGADQSVVRGDDLKALLDQVFEVQITINEATMALKTAEASAKLAAAGGTPTQETIDIGKEIIELEKQNVMLEDAIANSTYLSDTVKTA